MTWNTSSVANAVPSFGDIICVQNGLCKPHISHASRGVQCPREERSEERS